MHICVKFHFLKQHPQCIYIYIQMSSFSRVNMFNTLYVPLLILLAQASAAELAAAGHGPLKQPDPNHPTAEGEARFPISKMMCVYIYICTYIYIYMYIIAGMRVYRLFHSKTIIYIHIRKTGSISDKLCVQACMHSCFSQHHLHGTRSYVPGPG